MSRTGAVPRHRCLVVPWLREPGARFLLPGWLAITIGPLIVSWRALDPAELAHELEHVRQWRRHGLWFIPRYLRASRSVARTGGDGYRGNRFEIAARQAAGRVAAEVGRSSPGEPPASNTPATMATP